MTNDIRTHYDKLAAKRDAYIKKNKYYYSLLYKEYRYFIPKGKRILEVGCSTGSLLNALGPSYGVGIDISEESIKIARQKYPHLKFFVSDLLGFIGEDKFDYIILSGLLGELDDIQYFFEALKKFCAPHTRIIIEYYNYLWQYILKFAEKLKLKIPQKIQNWLTYQDINNFLSLSGYEPISRQGSILAPKNIILFSLLINKFVAKLPIFNSFTVAHFIIARPLFYEVNDYTVSIIIPCRNEKQNIEEAIKRIPIFGKGQEFIFIEGASCDGTFEEIQRLIQAYPGKDIKLYKQAGSGKADAVRLGFSKAKNEIFMILDADLTTPPEELPRFYEALKKNKAELANGCRLIYPMEKEAMRFLNLAANKIFSIIFSWLLGQNIKDTLCGTKALFRRHYEEIARNRDWFGDFDPFGDFDLLFGAAKLNLKITDIPVRYRQRTYGRTQISRFRHGWQLLKMTSFGLLKIKFI